MGSKKTQLVILFADISGSTRLYETLGDSLAHDKLSGFIESLTNIITRNNGVPIKTIGDEIMASFLKPDNALKAASSMQEEISLDELSDKVDIAVRIGFHFGPVIIEKNDVFGDTVNVAARLVDLAKGGQILTTRETVIHLSAHLQNTARQLYRIQVKGRNEGVDLFEVIWENIDVTYIGTMPKFSLSPDENILELTYKNKTKILSRERKAITIGRSPENDLVIEEPRVSRQHARIEYISGKFILSDQSSNGTYVNVEGNRPVFLRREKAILIGKGVIHFFPRKNPGNTDLIYYTCKTISI